MTSYKNLKVSIFTEFDWNSTVFQMEMMLVKCNLLYCVQLFMCAQFIQQGIRHDFNNIDEILNPPEGQDEGVWKYEHLRLHLAAVNLFCL